MIKLSVRITHGPFSISLKVLQVSHFYSVYRNYHILLGRKSQLEENYRFPDFVFAQMEKVGRTACVKCQNRQRRHRRQHFVLQIVVQQKNFTSARLYRLKYEIFKYFVVTQPL